ncbi:MAG: phosphopantetheine-binding protein [Pseudomonadota bacterium]
MNDNATIEQRLTNIIASKTKLEAADIHPQLNLEDSGLDSFARIELILVIEEEFSIELSDSESANVATIADLTSLINEKTAAS